MDEKFETGLMNYLQGIATDEEVQLIAECLQSDERYRLRFREMAKAYGLAALPLFQKRTERNFELLSQRLQISPRRVRLSRPWVWMAGAAAVVAFVLGWSIRTVVSPVSVQERSMEYSVVEVSGQNTACLTLPDGTVIRLNENSSLKYLSDFHSSSIREVFLSGEAYFEVAKDSLRPFVTHVDELDIKVLGTTFDVKAYDTDTIAEVALIEGKVNVSIRSDHRQQLILHPNEQAVFHKGSRLLNLQRGDSYRQIGWVTGKLVLSDETLADILLKVAQRYGVSIEVRSKRAHKERFTGSLDKGLSLEEVLQHLDVDRKYRWYKSTNKWIFTDKD